MSSPVPALDALIIYPPWAQHVAEASPWEERYLAAEYGNFNGKSPDVYGQVEAYDAERSGVIAHSYFEDFYFRIHIIPGSLNLGNLASDQSQDIYFWNAFFVTRTLSDVVPTNAEGLDISTPALPFAWKPLDDEIFTLLASSSIGPPTIDANFAFVFDDKTYGFRITGNRAVTLAYPPSRDAAYEEEFSWAVTVFTAASGKEQLMALTDDPKVSAAYNTYVFDEERWTLESKIWGWQARLYTCPVWKSSTTLREAAVSGGLYLAVKTTEDREFKVGGLAMLFFGPEDNETVEIQEVFADGLAVVRPVVRSWPAGTSVLPIRQMRLAREISYRGNVANDREFSFNLTTDQAETQVDYPWPWNYDGLPVLEFSPDMKAGLDGKFTRAITPLTTSYGKPYHYDQTGSGTQSPSWLFTFDSRKEAYTFLSLLAKLRGSCGFFWHPSWSPDITVVQTIALNANAIVAKGYGMATMYASLKGKHGVRIELKNGTIIYRRVTEISRGPGPGQETLTLNTEIPQTIYPEEIRYISFMAISRFAQDSFKFVWSTTEWAEVQVTIKGLSDAL